MEEKELPLSIYSYQCKLFSDGINRNGDMYVIPKVGEKYLSTNPNVEVTHIGDGIFKFTPILVEGTS